MFILGIIGLVVFTVAFIAFTICFKLAKDEVDLTEHEKKSINMFLTALVVIMLLGIIESIGVMIGR